MSTTIRIGLDDKRKLQQLCDIENISEREAVSRSIAYYQLALMKRFLEQGDFKFSPEMLEAFEKARQWLQRLAQRKYKELLKAKGD